MDRHAQFLRLYTKHQHRILAYIYTLVPSRADAEDLFTAKLKSYRQQLDVRLPQAVAASLATAGTISNIGLMSIPLERG
jgi:DNA-directed RNA polymerase specialized sigma24 family protein